MDPATIGFGLNRRVLPDGEEVADLEGELDILTAGLAATYVGEIIDGGSGPVAVNLAGVLFCDASGLRALLRMANHAERAGRPFRVLSPNPRLVRLMQITGLGQKFLAQGTAGKPGLPPAARASTLR